MTTNHPTNSITHCIGPQKVADLCVNVVIPGMLEKHKAVLSDYDSMISTFIVDHHLGSIRAQRFSPETFAVCFEQQICSDSPDIHWPLRYLWTALQEKLGGKQDSLKWEHIVNAVRHEMTDAIAQIVESASSKLKALKKDSGKELIKSIKRKKERNLTVAEAQYLRSLVERAINEMTLIPFDHS